MRMFSSIAVIIGVLVILSAGCGLTAPVKTSRFPWINTWAVEYYSAEGEPLKKDAAYFDLHMSPHNINGLKALSPDTKGFLYQLWREQYASDEEGAVKDRRKIRTWTSTNGVSPESFYCHYGKDISIKGTDPKSRKEETVVVPGWNPKNDTNADGLRDLPSDYGFSTSTGVGSLEDNQKEWKQDQWKGAVMVDKNGRTYRITGNNGKRLSLESGTPTDGRYGISSEGSVDHLATAKTRSEARVKTFIWENYAYAMNIGNPDYRRFRQYDAKKMLIEGDKSWDANANKIWDGFMVDNTQPEFPWAEVIDGKDYVLEYPDKSKWRSDQVELFKAVRGAVGQGKLLLGNTGSYDYPEVAHAGGGQHQEQYVAFTNEHGPVQWDYWKQQSLKKEYVLSLPSYGAYEKDPDRERMHYLAFHYIGQQPYIYLGFRGFGYREVYKWNPSADDWLPAVEVDVGKPLDDTYKLAASGKDPTGQAYNIYTRRYSKALIVCRPKILWSDEDYGDKTGVSFSLPPCDPSKGAANSYKPLLANGKLGNSVSKITLKHPESYILFPADLK